MYLELAFGPFYGAPSYLGLHRLRLYLFGELWATTQNASQELLSLGEFVAIPFVFRCRGHLLGCDCRDAQVLDDRRFVSRRRVPDPVRQAFGRLREIVFLAREYENSITFGVVTCEEARAHYANKPDAALHSVEGLTTRALVQVPAYQL